MSSALPLVGSEPPMKGITIISDSDVICGRGGAALRHPGNKTYRRLVNLNKALYVTCLKTEKLKISRSIVAAIREQKGRFLEQETETTWCDIGDPKAIEKTSQALREGQPKLRQKMAEMGGTAANESQYGHAAGIYPEQVERIPDPSALQMPPPPMVHHQQHPIHQMRMQSQAQQVAVAAAQNAILRQGQIQTMQQLPHPDSRRTSVHEELFKRLSVSDLSQNQDGSSQQQMQQQYPAQQFQHPHLQSQQQIYQQQQLYQQQMQQAGYQLQDHVSQQIASQSVMSLLSNYSSTESMRPCSEKSLLSGDAVGWTLGNMNQSAPSNGPSLTVNEFSTFNDTEDMNISAHQSLPFVSKLEHKLAQDRRRVFATMKYAPSSNNKASGGALPATSNHSLGDGMPDFHMVESTLSLFSNLSVMTDGKSETVKAHPVGSKVQPEVVKIVDHSALGNNNYNKLDRSGHSMMSMSSIDSNLFADFKKNISSRSIDEISALRMRELSDEDDDDDDEDNDDTDGFSHSRLDEGGAIL